MDGTFEGQIKKVPPPSNSRSGKTKWFKWKIGPDGKGQWWSQTGSHAVQAQEDYIAQQGGTTSSKIEVSSGQLAAAGDGTVARWPSNQKIDGTSHYVLFQFGTYVAPFAGLGGRETATGKDAYQIYITKVHQS